MAAKNTRFSTRSLLSSIAAIAVLVFAALASTPAFATYAFVQQQAVNNASSSTHTALSLSSITPSAGDLLVVVSLSSSVGTTGSIIDAGGTNTYTFIGDTLTGAGIFLNYYYAANVPATAVTIKNATAVGVALYVAEYSGISSTPLITSSFNFENGTQGTAANGVTSSAVSVTTVPALIFGFSATQSGSSGAVFSAGTGFTTRAGSSGVTVWPSLNSNTLANGFPEDLRLTSSGSQAATWTSNSAGQFDQALSGMVAFAEGGGGGAVQSKSMLLGIGATLRATPTSLYHEIDPLDFRRWMKRASNDFDYSHQRAA